MLKAICRGRKDPGRWIGTLPHWLLLSLRARELWVQTDSTFFRFAIAPQQFFWTVSMYTNSTLVNLSLYGFREHLNHHSQDVVRLLTYIVRWYFKLRNSYHISILLSVIFPKNVKDQNKVVLTCEKSILPVLYYDTVLEENILLKMF